MIRKRPELDTINPAGSVRPALEKPSHMEQPLSKNIENYIMDTEEMFSPQPNMSIYSRVRRILKK